MKWAIIIYLRRVLTHQRQLRFIFAFRSVNYIFHIHSSCVGGDLFRYKWEPATEITFIFIHDEERRKNSITFFLQIMNSSGKTPPQATALRSLSLLIKHARQEERDISFRPKYQTWP